MLWVHECTQMKHEISNPYERAANASDRGCVRVYSFQLYVFASALGRTSFTHICDESNFVISALEMCVSLCVCVSSSVAFFCSTQRTRCAFVRMCAR